MGKVSVIIPARNEEYLEATIRDLLKNAEGDIEIIVILDGYIPDPQIEIGDDRVTFLHYEESIGQRQGINEAARRATGKYVMKCDAHCAFDKGWDVKLAADCEYDWTVVPTMYNLDIEKWEPKRHKKTNYMYISSTDADKPFRASYYGSKQPKNDKMIDDIMCCMGPCFFMHRERFWELGGCDEGHGGWGQQGIEVALKAWLSGGSLKVNKNTWFAHWFRGGGGPGFPYSLTSGAVDKARKHSQGLWLNDKWEKQTRKLEWLIEKFDPPGWGNVMADKRTDELNNFFCSHIHRKNRDPRWRGVKVIKMPTDLILYQQEIWKNKPDFIVECGTAFGGATLFYADMLDMVGKGKVISIDIQDRGQPEHPRIEYLLGNTTCDPMVQQVKDMVGDGSVMVVLDSDHKRVHVKWELHKYNSIVTSGQYLVVEDCYDYKSRLVGPGEARDWFMKRYKGFTQKNVDKQFVFGFTRGGWLLKK